MAMLANTTLNKSAPRVSFAASAGETRIGIKATTVHRGNSYGTWWWLGVLV